jgi:hypothetical protein
MTDDNQYKQYLETLVIEWKRAAEQKPGNKPPAPDDCFIPRMKCSICGGKRVDVRPSHTAYVLYGSAAIIFQRDPLLVSAGSLWVGPDALPMNVSQRAS